MSETEYEQENVLHLAARHSHTKVIKATLEAGFEIDKPRNVSLGHYALSTLSSLEVKSGMPELIYAARNDYKLKSPEELLEAFKDLKPAKLIPPIEKALSIVEGSDFYKNKYTEPQYGKLLKLGDAIPKKTISEIKSHLDTYLRDHL